MKNQNEKQCCDVNVVKTEKGFRIEVEAQDQSCCAPPSCCETKKQ